MLGVDRAEGGSISTPTLLEVQAAVDEADSRLTAATHTLDRLRFALLSAAEEQQVAGRDVQAALDRLHESDARMAAVAEQLGQLGAQARAARGEAERLERAIEAASEQLADDREALAELEARLLAAEVEPTDGEPDTAPHDELAELAQTRRAGEVEARLTVRTGEERARALAGRAESLARAAQQERAARARLVARRERRAREAGVAREVALAAQAALAHLEHSLALAAADRELAQQVRVERDAERATLRGRTREAGRPSLERADRQRAPRRDGPGRAAAADRGAPAAGARGAGARRRDAGGRLRAGQPRPVLVPTPGSAGPTLGPTPGLTRVTHHDAPAGALRARRAGEAAAVRGAGAGPARARSTRWRWRSSPALEERHQFLAEQVEDLRRHPARPARHRARGRRAGGAGVHRAAFEDTAREFEGVFARLFPGGEGRLVLTDPATCSPPASRSRPGPPGKKVKRLSLLSGGERSLTAVALLVAIFRARPSPFYILDEVEAALDDTNLGRLLEIYEELRENSQLLVITHQKRTMEVADALYGVTMRGDGVTSGDQPAAARGGTGLTASLSFPNIG